MRVSGTLVALAACTAAFGQGTLAFDPTGFTTLHVTVDGTPMEVRRYRVLYVAKPIAMATVQPSRGPAPGAVVGGAAGPTMGAGPGPAVAPGPVDPYAHQSMYIYVPQRAFNDTRTAIILQVANGGWFASPAQDRVLEGGTYSGTNDTDSIGAALKAGYVIASVGTRSRGVKAADGSWAGKAPAVVVDAKAAVRYLRLNDAVMPGSAERIIITGTSGGGALSVAVAASGNSADYYPFLAEIGAAGIDARGRSTLRDDVFATVAYCPITDLGHADMAYEWQYHAVRTAANTNRGQYPADMQAASAALAAAYPAYLASLRLKREDGAALTVASLREAILAQVKRGTEAGIARGEKIPALGEDFVLRMRNQEIRVRNEWLNVTDGKVVQMDYDKYLQFVTQATPLKTVPAFDASANTGNRGVSGENTLFGPANVEYSNFAEYAWNHNDVKGDGSGADDTGREWAAYVAGPGRALAQQLRMVNPMTYLNSAADSAPYWYIRHGIADRDTAFAVELALYYGIQNDRSVKGVNFALAWLQGHAGNYDVQEAYAWIASVLATPGPTVRVTGGEVQGRVNPGGGASFKGVPFAQPPVSALRWKEPQPVNAWSGIRSAADYGHSCAQNTAGWNKLAVENMSEDCLYLNVWTPEWPANSAMPVMVWIHGGGNSGGSAMGAGGIEPPFDATALASKGVVVVTINYRLGILGFVGHPELTAESPHRASGGYGILDQVAALRWVRENIARFGGDPGNVTVFGQSAGAQDASILVASPLTRGLIHKAIVQSGSPMISDRRLLTPRQTEQLGVILASALKAPATGAVAFMRSLPTEQLFAALPDFRQGMTEQKLNLDVAIDGYAVPEWSPRVYMSRRQAPVAMIVGSNGLDSPGYRATANGTAEEMQAAVRARIGPIYGAYAELLSRAEAAYLSAPAPTANPAYGSLDRQAAVDHSFRCTTAAVARWQSAVAPTYHYEFNAADAQRPPNHSAELDFVFGYLRDRPAGSTLAKLSEQMQQYWTNFAKTGNPNGQGLPEWPKYDDKARAYMELGSEGPQAKADLRSAICPVYFEKLSRDVAVK